MDLATLLQLYWKYLDRKRVQLTDTGYGPITDGLHGHRLDMRAPDLRHLAYNVFAPGGLDPDGSTTLAPDNLRKPDCQLNSLQRAAKHAWREIDDALRERGILLDMSDEKQKLSLGENPAWFGRVRRARRSA